VISLGVASQTAAIHRWVDSSGNRIAYIDSDTGTTGGGANGSYFAIKTFTASKRASFAAYNNSNSYTEQGFTGSSYSMGVGASKAFIRSSTGELYIVDAGMNRSALFVSNLTASGTVTTTPGTRSGPGAVPITVSAVALTTTGVADALTLANGTNGQILTISHVSRGGGTGTAVLTPTTTNGYTTITFTATGDGVTLQYHTTGGWHIVGSRGVTIA
jgi:hypothetical protein